ncbi:MAG: sigma-54-dependent transcriptional regulator [bacterium]
MARKVDEKKLLVVDDESLINDFLREIFVRKGFTVDQAFDGSAAIKMIQQHRYDVLIIDRKMPDISGIEVLKAQMAQDPSIPVIIMTAYGSIDGAVEAMKLGAFDYIIKPFDADQIEAVVHKALGKGDEKRPWETSQMRIIGKSPKILSVLEMIQIVAPTNSTVLITGETGTGKELVAREIQRLSKRSDKPFIRINCAALPEGLIESELFGHEKGAFTGAVRTRRGKFELADGGTILLDEIGEIAISTQAKILRVLQEKEFERIGSDHIRTVDVRAIATTNKNLAEQMSAGRFREDLFYRLNVFPIDLPPLRERKEDIPLLIEHFIQRYRPLCNSRVFGIEKDALDYLMEHNWPGNVRELENCIERAMIVCKGEMIQKNDIMPPTSFRSKDHLSLDPGISLREMEKIMVLKTLESIGWNRTKAAAKLGISTRTLRNKLKEYKLEESSQRWEENSLVPTA